MKRVLIILFVLSIIIISCNIIQKDKNISLPLGLKFNESIFDVEKKIKNLNLSYNTKNIQNRDFTQNIIKIRDIQYRKYKGTFIILFFNKRLYQVRFYTSKYYLLKEKTKNRYMFDGKLEVVKKSGNKVVEYYKKDNEILAIIFTDKNIEEKIFSD